MTLIESLGQDEKGQQAPTLAIQVHAWALLIQKLQYFELSLPLAPMQAQALEDQKSVAMQVV